MKKAVCLTLALAMLFSLAACGGGGTATQAPSVALPTNDMPANYNPAPTGSGGSQTAPSDAPDSDDPQYGGVVRFVELGTNGGTAQPFGLTWMPLFATTYSVPWAETLVLFTQDGVYEPHLAEDWNIDTEAHTITFYLRQGISFSDGSPFNAEAAAWNINMWPQDGRGNEEIIEEAWAEDEYTLVIPYDNWQNVLFETFASHAYAIVSMQNYLDNGRDYSLNNPVGTGPFVLSEWTPGSHIKFTRNDNYWMEGKPYLDGVEYYEITDPMIQNTAMLSSGEGCIDFFQCSNAEQAHTLISQGTDHDSTYMRGGGTLTLCPSSDNPDSPFADLKVRQAVAYAIDREAIVEAKGFGVDQPAYQITAAGFAGSLPADNPNLVKYDVEMAKQLLTEAGYPDGFSTTLYSSPSFQDQMVIIQAQLAEIGIICELQFPEPGLINDLNYNGWEGLFVVSFGQVMNTGISYYIWYHPDQDSYVSAMRPEEYEAMYYEARRSFDVDNELFGRLGNLILEYMTFIPLYHRYSVYFVRNGIQDHGYHKYSVDTMWTPWNAYWEAGSPRLG